MKNTIFYLLLLGCLGLNACQEQVSDEPRASTNEETREAFDEAAEQAAILAVIESETACFFQRDYACWKEHWIHEKYAFQAWNNSDGTFDAAVGWDAIHDQGKTYIDDVPEGQTETSHPLVKRANMQFKFYGDNLAYLIWEQYNSDRNNEFFSKSQETRLMEKVNGNWKIVNVTALWDTVNTIPFGELED